VLSYDTKYLELVPDPDPHKKTLASLHQNGVQKSKEFGLGKAKALPKRVLVNVSEPLGR
jgi:hypothetical protein